MFICLYSCCIVLITFTLVLLKFKMADSADETIKFREKPDIGTTMAEAAETSAIVMPDASKQPLMQQPLILSETNVATKMDDFYQLGKYT